MVKAIRRWLALHVLCYLLHLHDDRIHQHDTGWVRLTCRRCGRREYIKGLWPH